MKIFLIIIAVYAVVITFTYGLCKASGTADEQAERDFENFLLNIEKYKNQTE